MAQVKKASKTAPRAESKDQPNVVAAAAPQSYAMRETVESIVIAFVLAFLFRTFEAEAFVIPTGSMAPTLMGRHKDVDCPKCGHRYRVSASEEENEALQGARLPEMKCVGGMCPMCRYVMAMTPDLPAEVLAGRDPKEISWQPSYNGDRILVNKYVYTISDPQRWDVVVFHFPGNAQMNYIKRMVGLPGETLRVYQGDLYARAADAPPDGEFAILRKPADKVLAVRQSVHDTDYDPVELISAGWPLRWQKIQSDGANWNVLAEPAGGDMRERFAIDRSGEGEAWLRYHHFVPEFGVWDSLIQLHQDSPPNATSAAKLPENVLARPQLVMDFNAYNTRLLRRDVLAGQGLHVDPTKTGVHWVGDLMLEADVDVQEARGELLLDLVEGGKHFTCRIDLTNGKAKLSAEGVVDYAPATTTALLGTGKHRVGFANVDDQLLLWVDGSLVEFDGGTAYDAKAVFGDREKLLPRTSADDPGDLAPAGIGVRDAKLSVNRLQVWRDIYYIADSSRNNTRFDVISDFDRSPEVFLDSLSNDPAARKIRLSRNPRAALLLELPFTPALWSRFADRRHEDFLLGNDQYFVMGDNSAESSDARLWRGEAARGGRPGGEYLERRLLIGKALCVYWPHAWYYVPKTPIPVFPNFRDMRLVR